MSPLCAGNTPDLGKGNTDREIIVRPADILDYRADVAQDVIGMACGIIDDILDIFRCSQVLRMQRERSDFAIEEIVNR